MKYSIFFFIILLFNICKAQVKNVIHSSEIKILYNEQNSDSAVIQFYDRIDTLKKINYSLNLREKNFILSPSKKYVAVVNYIESLKYEVTVYNQFYEIVKNCFLDSVENLSISNDLRFANEGRHFSVAGKRTKLKFYDNRCKQITTYLNYPFGYKRESLFSNNNDFYFLTINDTMLCENTCNPVLYIFNSKFKIIATHIFDNVNVWEVFNLKLEHNDLVSLSLISNGIESKIILNRKGEIIKN